jgi:hypothetical protein
MMYFVKAPTFHEVHGGSPQMMIPSNSARVQCPFLMLSLYKFC